MDKGEATAPASERLFSLDALRGLDMILLTVVGPLVCAAQKGWACFSPGFMRQFGHGWECFTLWDIIMPLFIFMCGAAVPLALEVIVLVAVLSIWRAAKKGYAAQQFLKRK